MLCERAAEQVGFQRTGRGLDEIALDREHARSVVTARLQQPGIGERAGADVDGTAPCDAAVVAQVGRSRQRGAADQHDLAVIDREGGRIQRAFFDPQRAAVGERHRQRERRRTALDQQAGIVDASGAGVRDARVVFQRQAATGKHGQARVVQAHAVAVLVGDRQVAGHADFARGVLVRCIRRQRRIAGQREHAAARHRSGVPDEAVEHGDVAAAGERAAAQFEVVDAECAARRQRATGKPECARSGELCRRVGGQRAGILLQRTWPRQCELTTEQIVGRTVCGDEKRAATCNRDAAAARGRQARLAVAAAVVAFVQIDVGIAGCDQRAGRTDVQRAAIADVQVVAGAVAEIEGAVHFQPAVQVAVDRTAVDGAGAGEHSGAGPRQRAGVPVQRVDRDRGRTIQRAARQVEVGDSGGRSGVQRSTGEAERTRPGERAALIYREQAGIHLYRTRAGELETAANEVGCRTVGGQEQRAAFGRGDASACGGTQHGGAVVAAVVTFVEVDVGVGGGGQRAAGGDVQRATVADVQVIAAAVAHFERAGDIQPAVEIAVGGAVVHRAGAGKHHAAGAFHRARLPEQSVQRGGGRSGQRAAAQVQRCERGRGVGR